MNNYYADPTLIGAAHYAAAVAAVDLELSAGGRRNARDAVVAEIEPRRRVGRAGGRRRSRG